MVMTYETYETYETYPPIAVVIPCHTERQWPELVAALAAIRTQSPRPAEIVVVVDHNDALYERARAGLAGVTVLANRRRRGASGNRNTGAFHTSAPLIAFLDGDSVPDPGWLAALAAPFQDPAVVGTGGAIRPHWQGHRPGWFPDEFLWPVGGSYPGLPTTTAPVRNVWSASMAVRRDVFAAIGGFEEGFGKVGNRSRPEDTELCLRMGRFGRWMYAPAAVIEHPVEPAHGTIGYFLRRCFHEGRGKVQLSRLRHGWRSLSSERDYLRRTVPQAVLRGLSDGMREPGAGHAARAGAMIAGLAAAAAGGAIESVSRRSAADPEGATS
jgi:glucosyl-dolichyl phosphate glucuronosyltransferase